MRIFSIGAITLVAFGVTNVAVAADQAVPRSPTRVAASSWTGLYFGAAAGYGAFLDRERTFDPGAALFLEQDAATNGRGPLGSVFVGYDYQFAPNVVVGAFAEYEWSDFTFKFDAPFNTVRVRQDSSWWIGGRVGYTPNCCTLWFLSAGYTRNHTDFSSASPPPPLTVISFLPTDGWFVGAGVETKLGGNFSLRTEYRFAHYSERKTFEDTTSLADLLSQRVVQSGRIALAYRLDGSPVVPTSTSSGRPIVTKAPPRAIEEEPSRWTAFYVGAGAGYGVFLGKGTDILPFIPAIIVRDAAWGGRGPLGTVVAGYDHQITPRFVLGGFAEYDFAALEYTQSAQDMGILFPFLFTELKQKSAWSVGARAGYVPFCCTMLYLSGGYTSARFEANFTAVPPTFTTANYGDFDGWFVGAGAETKLTRNFAVRFEYRYAQLEEKAVIVDTDPLFPGTALFKPTIQNGRALLIYRFN